MTSASTSCRATIVRSGLLPIAAPAPWALSQNPGFQGVAQLQILEATDLLSQPLRSWAADPDIGDDELRLLLAIYDHEPVGGGWAWPSNATLAARIGKSEGHVRRLLPSLERRGYLTRKGGGRKRYIMTGNPRASDAETRAPATRKPARQRRAEGGVGRSDKKNPPNPPSQGGTVRFSDRDRRVVSKAWAVPGMYGDTRIAWRALDEAGRSEAKLKAAFAWWADNPGTQLPGKVVA